MSHAHNVSVRRFLPNIQTVKALLDGQVRRIYACTRCLRSGRVVKAPGSGTGAGSGSAGRPAGRVDLEARPLRQAGHGDGRARRRRRRTEDLAVDLVDAGEVAHVGEVERRLDDVGRRAAGGGEDGDEVRERLSRLGDDVAVADELAGLRIDLDLARAGDERATANGPRSTGGRPPSTRSATTSAVMGARRMPLR